MLMSNLSIIVRGGQVYCTRKLSEYGLNAGEQYILMYLMGHEESNQDSIAKFFMLDKGAVARTLAKLESKGFIVRKVNDDNQREKVIKLTEKSFEMRDVLNGLLAEWNELMFDGISDEEISSFENIVEKIAANISQKL
ncbi:MAG: MarR family transcriptional regulator [Clostridiales bacterium]|nr:MarR family transcriptional regulator [Clostridiales bacterium]